MSDKSGMKSIKELPEVLKLDGAINTYVNLDSNGYTYRNIQGLFWEAIEAIQKAVNNLDESHPQPEKPSLQQITYMERIGNDEADYLKYLDEQKSQPEAQPEPIKVDQDTLWKEVYKILEVPAKTAPGAAPEKKKAFQDEIAEVINRYSMENGSDTPDFILAEYLTACLDAFNFSTRARDLWKTPGAENGETKTIND